MNTEFITGEADPPWMKRLARRCYAAAVVGIEVGLSHGVDEPITELHPGSLSTPACVKSWKQLQSTFSRVRLSMIPSRRHLEAWEDAMEVLYSHCAGLDVHKDTVVACARPMSDGKIERQVRTFKTVTTDLLALSEWLASQGCTHVAI